MLELAFSFISIRLPAVMCCGRYGFSLLDVSIEELALGNDLNFCLKAPSELTS